MNGQWIFTEHTQGDRWGSLGLRSAGGISASEWFNINTGAGLLLAPDGKWNEGGRWHLYYLAPGSVTPVSIDHLLSPIDARYRRNPVHWAEVEQRCMAFVQHLLGEGVVPFSSIVESYQASLAEQARQAEAAHQAAADDDDSQAVEPEPAGQD